MPILVTILRLIMVLTLPIQKKGIVQVIVQKEGKMVAIVILQHLYLILRDRLTRFLA